MIRKTVTIALALFVPVAHAAQDKAPLNPLETLKNEWKYEYEIEGVKVYSQKKTAQDLVAFAGEAELAVDSRKVLHAIKDANRANQWMPNLKHRELLDRAADGTDHTTYSIFSLGYGLSERDVVARTQQSSDNGWIVLHTKSSSHRSKPLNEKFVRMWIEYTDVYLQPSGTSTKVVVMTLADLRGWIPSMASNYLRRRFPVAYLKALESTAKGVEVVAVE